MKGRFVCYGFFHKFDISRLSEEFEIGDIFLQEQRFFDGQAFLKDSLCLEQLTNLDAKGAKRSVKIRAAN